MLDFAIEDASVAPLVFLFEAFDPEDDLIGLPIGPGLEPVLHGKVLEPLEELDGRRGIAPYLQHTKEGLFLTSGPLVAGFVGKFDIGTRPGLERVGLPVPALNEASDI